MKKTVWWILGIVLTPVLLFVVLVGLLYLPPVQNWAVDKVAEIASEKTGMQITVGHVQLAFPLDLSIDDFLVLSPTATNHDTIADVKHLVVNVQLWPLLHKQVVINELDVTTVSLNTNGFIDAARVKGNFKRLFVKSRGIDLDHQTVEVNGARIEDAWFDIALNDSVPEDTTKTETIWKINADSISIIHTDVVLHTPGDTMSVEARFGSFVAREALVDLQDQTYTVGSVDWIDGTLKYDKNFVTPVSGLDINHFDLTSVNIGIDSVYYHDPTLRMQMRKVALREKSGLQVSELEGAFSMEDGSIKLPKLRLKTPDSDVLVTMDMPLSLTDSIDAGKMRLKMDAQLGRQDLMHFMLALPQAVKDRWPHYPLTVKGTVDGNLNDMTFNDVDISLPTVFHATASGTAAHLNNLKQLRADVQFKAEAQNLGMVTALLPRDVQRNYRIPGGLRADGRVKADGTQYVADVTLREGQGTVNVNANVNVNINDKGQLNTDLMRYDAMVKVHNLNVHHFMPHDSIYTVTADIRAKGQGTDFFSPSTTLMADAHVSQLNYGHWNLSNITAQADVRKGRGRVDVTSHNQLLDGTIGIDALMNKRKIDATVTADFNRLDLWKLELADRPLSIGMCGHIDVSSDLKLTHMASGLLNDLTISDSTHVFRPGDIGILVKARPDTTYARLQSGDFIVKLDASGNYERLLRQLTVLSDSVTEQFAQKIIDQPAIRRLLPTMKLHVESKQENPISSLLKNSRGIDFKDLLLDISSSPESGLNGNGYVHSLTISDMRLDTINFRLTQRQQHLSFGGQVRNNKKNPQFVFNALFDGVLQERGATFGMRLFDSDNKLGARLGAKAEMVDSGINLHLVPERPTLGYKEFNLNNDNYIFLGSNNRVKTKIDLVADDGTGVKIYSEDNDPTALQDITVTLNKFNLDEVTAVLPYVPHMTGILNGDFHVVQDANRQFSVVSDMAVRNMTYERSPIGNVSTELVYLQKEGDAHALEARLMKDDEEIGLLTGTYYNKKGSGEEAGSIDARFMMERLPLSIVNGFVPDQLLGLQGYGEGELAVKGTLEKPQVNGEVYLDSAYLVSIPYGVTLRFDNDPVRIVDSRLLFENFGLYAYNDQPLNMQGNIDFSNTSKVTMDMRMRAQNFQIINAKQVPGSIAFGKAFVNFFARMNGPIEALSMRGRLDVLGSTDMTYMLLDSPLSTDNRLDELVKFTDFNDTTQTVITRPVPSGLNVSLNISVSQGAHIVCDLNTEQTNYVDLMGGGDLRLTYNNEGIGLTGRYTLSNGEMKYSLPIIPLKTFTIQDGSYVEFTGDPTNPRLNITATERVKATVGSEGTQSRSVAFDCGVVITKTLNDMGLEFIISAPEDMSVNNELQSMSAEERGKLAVTMLTTGMYLADGNTSGFSMNSALSSFLQSEINNITGSALKTLDLSVGMDNTTDASGSVHTDYSFKFSKRFFDNRLRIQLGGKVSTGAEMPGQKQSFFDNVTMEYRLDQNGQKNVKLFYNQNVYDWLDGYTGVYGVGFVWRKKMNSLLDVFKVFSKDTQQPLMRRPPTERRDSVNVPATPNLAPSKNDNVNVQRQQ